MEPNKKHFHVGLKLHQNPTSSSSCRQFAYLKVQKIALKIEGQGEMLPKCNHIERRPWHSNQVTSISVQWFFSYCEDAHTDRCR